MNPKPSDRAVAIHDAAHAVVALLGGISVRYITLRPRGGDLLGCAVFRPRSGRTKARARSVVARTRPFDEARARVDLAGRIAERYLLRREPPRGSDALDRTNIAFAVDHILGRRPPNGTNYAAVFEEDFDDEFGNEIGAILRLQAEKYNRIHRRYDSLGPDRPRRDGPKEKPRLIRRLRRETRALVVENWSAITAIAEALLERKTLSGAEIGRIMNQHSKQSQNVH